MITITDSPPVRPLDCNTFLCYLVRWSVAISQQGFKSLAAIPNTACICWTDTSSGIWRDAYDYHNQVFSVSFNLSERRVIRNNISLEVKEQARVRRRDYLFRNVGPLPDEPRANRKGCVDGNTKWGHCAETLALMR